MSNVKGTGPVTEVKVTLAFGRQTKPIAVIDLLKADTHEAWSALLANQPFANSLLTPAMRPHLSRAVDLAIEGHNASAYFLSENMRLFSLEEINNWQNDGRLDQLLPKLNASAVVALALRPEASPSTIIHLAGHAAYNDAAQTALTNLLNSWSETKLEELAQQNQLRPLLAALPVKNLLSLMEKTELYDDEHFNGPIDQLLERTVELVKHRNFEAGILLDKAASEWTEEYLEHLATFDKLTEILQLLSPITVIGLAKQHKKADYDPFSHKGVRDRLIIRVMALTIQGGKRSKNQSS